MLSFLTVDFLASRYVGGIMRILFDTITILFILLDFWYLGAMQNISILAEHYRPYISFVYYPQGTILRS